MMRPVTEVWLRILAGLVLLVAVVTLAAPTGSAQADEELLLLRTSAGDVLIELYRDSAPQTVSQITTLVDAGLYNNMPIVRVIDNFVVQTGLIESDLVPAPSVDELALVQKLPLEVDDAPLHMRGTLSLARYDEPDSGTSSFSILLGDFPHLDGAYTTFGRVIEGMAVIDTMARVPTDATERPVLGLVIWAAAIGTEADLRSLDHFSTVPDPATVEWFGSVPGIATGSGVSAGTGVNGSRSTGPGTVAALVGALIFGIAAFVLAGRIEPRFVGAIGLLAALSAGFGLFVILIPGNGGLTAVLVLVGIVGFLRLLSRFESIGTPAPVAAGEPAESATTGAPTSTTTGQQDSGGESDEPQRLELDGTQTAELT